MQSKDTRPRCFLLSLTGSRGAGAAAARASSPFSFFVGPHRGTTQILTGCLAEITQGEKCQDFLWAERGGRKEVQWWWFSRTVLGSCHSMPEADTALLLPLALALLSLASQWGAAHPCIRRAIFSGLGRCVVAYFLSGTTARASLDKGNGMC